MLRPPWREGADAYRPAHRGVLGRRVCGSPFGPATPSPQYSFDQLATLPPGSAEPYALDDAWPGMRPAGPAAQTNSMHKGDLQGDYCQDTHALPVSRPSTPQRSWLLTYGRYRYRTCSNSVRLVPLCTGGRHAGP